MQRKFLFFFGLVVILFILIFIVFVKINTPNQKINEYTSNFAASPTQTPVAINTSFPTMSAFTNITPGTTKNGSLPIKNTSTPADSYNISPKIGTISLDTRKDDILEILGEPTVQTSVHGNGSPEWDYPNGITLYLGNFNKKYSGDLWRIIVKSPYDGATVEGLKLGDSKETFFQIYGKYGIGFPQGSTLQFKSSNDVTLFVEFDKNGKVSSIALGRE